MLSSANHQTINKRNAIRLKKPKSPGGWFRNAYIVSTYSEKNMNGNDILAGVEMSENFAICFGLLFLQKLSNSLFAVVGLSGGGVGFDAKVKSMGEGKGVDVVE